MEPLRLSPVVFCGENPNIVLINPDTKIITAAASYWQSTYSPYGEGNVLLLYLGAANAAALNQPTTAIYADNVPLARFVTDTFNQHFDEWKPFDFLNTAVQQARFFKESASGQFYRVGCHAEKSVIDLHWGAIRLSGYRLFPDIFGGGLGVAKNEHYHVSNVISVCEIGKITVNGSEVNGKPDTNILPDGRLSSSVFLAHSETWIKTEEIT